MTEENTHEEQRTPPIGDDKLGAILFDFPATMSGGTLKMTFYPRHSDGFTADAEGRLHSRDMEQLIMYMGMLDQRLAETKAERSEAHAQALQAQGVREQQDAAAVAPQVYASPMVQEAVNLGGTVVSQEQVGPRCPDHPDREPRPSNYGGVYCTAKLAAPIQVTRPDGSVKMSEFCIWRMKS